MPFEKNAGQQNDAMRTACRLIEKDASAGARMHPTPLVLVE
jgi:hypothetical protein